METGVFSRLGRGENFRRTANLSQLCVELFVVIYFDGLCIRIPYKRERTSVRDNGRYYDNVLKYLSHG